MHAIKAISFLFALLLLTIQGFSQTPLSKIPPLQDPDLKTFVDAAHTAGLQDIFQGTGPFTFFVPSNAAMEKYGSEKLKKLLKPENHDALVDLIIYHVVPGEYLAKALKTMSVKTINGKDLNIVVENGEIRVNGAKVIRTDMEGPNGVVHEIDAVLVP